VLEFEVPLQPKQSECLALAEKSHHTWIGYGGSRGGAKSHFVRGFQVIRRMSYPRTVGMIFRRTWEKVRENHIEPLFRQYPFMRDWYHAQNREVTFPNGSKIAFRYGENQQDVEALIGNEYMDICADQGEMLTEKEHNILKSCCRWPGQPDTQCKYLVTFNPGNIGHAFLKRVFYDRKFHEKERAGDYAFLQAFGWDNVEWSRSALEQDGLTVKEYYAWDEDTRYRYFIERSQYGRELDALPQAMRIGWLLGRMDQFAGQYFDCFSLERHVAKEVIKDWYPLWLSVDWGFAHDAAAYWHTSYNLSERQKKTYTYREYCKSGRSPRALAMEIVENTPEAERKRIDAIYLSHDAFAQKTSPDTIALQMGEVFKAYGMPLPTKEDRDPVGGATLFYQMLQTNELTISPECRKLIETIPMVTRDEDKAEETVKFEGDDSYDAARIGYKMRYKPRNTPALIKLREEAARIEDPIARHFFVAKRQSSIEEEGAPFRAKTIPTWQQKS
jgi:phage terminase large subunit